MKDSSTGAAWIGFWVALATLLVAFYGEPDLVDALIFNLTDGHVPLSDLIADQTK